MKSINMEQLNCRIKILDNQSPIFIIEKCSKNTYKYFEILNTITLPSINYVKFTKNELKLLKNQDVYFLPNIHILEIDMKYSSIKKLVNQVKPYCRTTKTISLFDFLHFNNIDFDGKYLDLCRAVEASNLDEISFHDILIYFCNLDLVDLQFTIKSCAKDEVYIKKIHKLINSFSTNFKNLNEKKS